MPIEFGSFSLGALAGGIVIGIANHYLSKSRDKESRETIDFNKAADEFRNAFLPELAFLKHNVVIPENERMYTTLAEYLQSGFINRHLKAFEIFRNYLSSKERKDIDKAWEQYCHDKDNSIALYYEQFEIEGKKPTDKIESEKELVLKRIEKILKFAKHK
jgi:hypothetical protein